MFALLKRCLGTAGGEAGACLLVFQLAARLFLFVDQQGQHRKGTSRHLSQQAARTTAGVDHLTVVRLGYSKTVKKHPGSTLAHASSGSLTCIRQGAPKASPDSAVGRFPMPLQSAFRAYVACSLLNCSASRTKRRSTFLQAGEHFPKKLRRTFKNEEKATSGHFVFKHLR